MELATLIPGAPLLDDNALDIMTGLGINTSINGSRRNYNMLTVDGGFNQDGGSNNSIISNVGIDFIEEVSIKTSNFSAEYGRASGAAINIVSRRGTNKIKGSIFGTSSMMLSMMIIETTTLFLRASTISLEAIVQVILRLSASVSLFLSGISVIST